jgi:hypothetical protein
MSHYPVIVIGPDPDGQLAPYEEGLTVPPYLDPSWDHDAMVTLARRVAAKDRPAGIDLEDPSALLGWFFDQDVADGLITVDDDGRWQRWSTANPEGRWDWYVLGGRWRGYFALVAGGRCIAAADGAAHGRCDQALRAHLDLDAMRNDAAIAAAGRFDSYSAMVAATGTPPPRPDRDAGSDPDSDAWTAYRSHPTVQAASSAFGMALTDLEAHFHHGERYAYIAACVAEAVPAHALVADGAWMEPGRMGWFGVDTATDASRKRYLSAANEILDHLDGDALVSVYDCHI